MTFFVTMRLRVSLAPGNLVAAVEVQPRDAAFPAAAFKEMMALAGFGAGNDLEFHKIIRLLFQFRYSLGLVAVH